MRHLPRQPRPEIRQPRPVVPLLPRHAHVGGVVFAARDVLWDLCCQEYYIVLTCDGRRRCHTHRLRLHLRCRCRLCQASVLAPHHGDGVGARWARVRRRRRCIVSTGGRHRSEQPADTITQSHNPLTARHHTGCSVADRGVDHPPVELGHPRRSLPMTFRETAERTPGRHNQCTRKAPRMMQASVLAVVVCCTLAALVGTLVPALRRGPGALPDASHCLQGASRRRPRPGSSAPGSSLAWPPPTCTSQWPACARPGKRTAVVGAVVVALVVAGPAAARQ